MEQRGQIAFLPELIALIIFLIIAIILFFFFKSLLVALVCGVVGGALLWKQLNTLEKKSSQRIAAIGAILIFVGLFVGITNPSFLASINSTISPNPDVVNISHPSGSLFEGSDVTSGHIVQSGQGLNLLASATNVDATCSPTSPYDACNQTTYTDIGLSAMARVMTYSNVQKLVNSYFDKRAYWGYSNTSTKSYYTSACYSSWTNFWNAANCNESGCSFTETAAVNEVTFASYGGSFSGCPTTIAWTRKDNSSGGWIYTSQAWGWNAGNPLNIVANSIAQCSVAADCSGGKVCDFVSTRKCVDCVGSSVYCNGFIQSKCVNNALVVQPVVKGVCGVTCISNSDCVTNNSSVTKCESNTLFTATNTGSCTNYACASTSTNNKLKSCILGCGTSICNEDDLVGLAEGNPYVVIGGIAGIGILLLFLFKRKRRR